MCWWEFGWAALSRWDKHPGYFQLGACIAGGHQSVVTCLHESLGKDVKKEPPDELMNRYGYGSFLTGILIVTGEESDPVVAYLHEAMVGDGNLVRVESQVLEDVVLEDDWMELLGHGKDHMEVVSRENLGPHLCEPLCASEALALGAVPVATRVV